MLILSCNLHKRDNVSPHLSMQIYSVITSLIPDIWLEPLTLGTREQSWRLGYENGNPSLAYPLDLLTIVMVKHYSALPGMAKEKKFEKSPVDEGITQQQWMYRKILNKIRALNLSDL